MDVTFMTLSFNKNDLNEMYLVCTDEIRSVNRFETVNDLTTNPNVTEILSLNAIFEAGGSISNHVRGMCKSAKDQFSSFYEYRVLAGSICQMGKYVEPSEMFSY